MIHTVWEVPARRYIYKEDRLDTRRIFANYSVPFIMYADGTHYYVFYNHAVTRVGQKASCISKRMS